MPLTNHVKDNIVMMHIPNMNFKVCRSESEMAPLQTAHFHSSDLSAPSLIKHLLESTYRFDFGRALGCILENVIAHCRPPGFLQMLFE